MTWQQLRAAADAMQPAARRAWLRAIRLVERRVTAAAVARILSARTPQAATRAVEAIVTTKAFEPFADVLRRGFMHAAGSDAMLRASFTAINKKAVEVAASKHVASRVTRVSASTKASIRSVIRRTVAGEGTAQTAAREIRQLVGVTTRQARSLAAERAALEAEDRTDEQIEARLDRLSARMVRDRARTIARTETLRAANEGQVAVWAEGQASGLLPDTVMKRWIVTPDDRLCLACQEMADQEQPIDAEFESDIFGATLSPPLHPNCRCAVVLSEAEGTSAEAADAA